MFATLARLFLPSWRFFDEALTGVVLKARTTAPSREPGAWRELLLPPTRRLHHLVWNPHGNRTLAAYSLLERLTQEAAEGESSVAFQRTHRLVMHLVQEELALASREPGTLFEFQLCDRTASGDEVLIASGPHEC